MCAYARVQAGEGISSAEIEAGRRHIGGADGGEGAVAPSTEGVGGGMGTSRVWRIMRS